MKILVFSWRDPKHPLAGGAEQVMHEHMKGWVRAGHRVTLFSSRLKNFPREEVFDGIKIIRGGYQYLGVILVGLLHYLKNKHRYDLVVDQFHGLPFFTPLYVRKPKLAVIQETARNVWFLNPLPKPLNWVIGVIGYLGEPFIFLLYRRVPFMTGSESAKAGVQKFGIDGKKINVVSHGVIVKKPQPFPAKEKNFTITFLGVLSKDKGIEDALKCFSLLGDGLQLWVIGKPETEQYGEYLKKLVKKLKLKKKVKFWGFVSQEEKFKLLAKSHLLINPSAREGWGLVNIEANSMGTPVIAYKSAGLVDSVKDGQSGVLCGENSPKSLTENILKIFQNKEKYNLLQKGALKWSQNFSWEKSVKLSLKLINQTK